ncbi:serine/threonine-protein kinase [Polyangium sp. y55x31]|uniref:serine/threonine-protein kinase n=1 Tax=Polyangium sp. y55x31 TaxID=3042688 RepID=UPI002482867B|nr:serine/threonine-protein kinase [Polyangium sp. y55x31]MDI1483146.1 serine/threonine-protein kinase [Polyangium sp. y55x31]
MTEPSALPGLPRLAKYELIEEIGHGGMATVYRARDVRLGREVAIKLIHKHLRENTEVAARFVAEARAAAKLRHPGIVEVYDVSSEEDAERYLVVELCRGTTLRKILQRHRDMPAEIGASIVFVLCEALEHAHACGIVHRDVKPENVLVELPADRTSESRARVDKVDLTPVPDGPRSTPRPVPSRAGDLGVLIKLTDFGIAKLLDAQGVTSTGQVLGSPAHMAPEQIEAGEVDGRTDVFALGVLMYECLVGHLPFEGKNPAQVLRRVLEGDYQPADHERPTVGGRFARIIDGALAHAAADRIAGPGKLGELIRAELEALGITDPRREIEAYFEDPVGYAEALTARLVPCLVARGETARKAGDRTGAAADFNRAHALAPNDLAILKRVTSLSASAERQRLVRRVAGLVAGALVLGVGAFVVARMRKPALAIETDAGPKTEGTTASTEHPKNPSAPDASADPRVPSTAPPSINLADPPRSIRIKLPLSAPTTSAATAPPAPPDLRRVVFLVSPQGATLVLDGKEEKHFSRVFTLKPGAHSVSARVKDSKCCGTFDGTLLVEAPPENDPDDVQRFRVRLTPLPSTVSLGPAPANAQVVCSDIKLTLFPGATKKVQLEEITYDNKCQFTTQGEEPFRSNVSLRAGEHNVVPWPAR